MGREECVGLGTWHLLEGAWQHAEVVARCCWLECILNAGQNDGQVLDLAGWAAVSLNQLDSKAWSLDGRLGLVWAFPECRLGLATEEGQSGEGMRRDRGSDLVKAFLGRSSDSAKEDSRRERRS